jgi:hypothetical protein
MSITTVSGNDKKQPEPTYAEVHKDVKDNNIPLTNNKFLKHVIRLTTYRVTLEIMKSVFIIFVCLSAYKVAGLHDMWVQLVEKYFYAIVFDVRRIQRFYPVTGHA